MSFVSRIRTYVAATVSGVIGLLLALPYFYALALRSRLERAAGSVRRQRTGTWFHDWTRFFLRVFEVVGGLRCRILFQTPTLTDDDRKGGMIVIVNHHGGFDALLLSELFARMGMRDYRTVAMKEVDSIPLVNHFFREAGCAFVSRNRNPEDLARVRRFAADCMADGASAAIFPEGAMFEGPVPDSGFERVLKPKWKGLTEMVREMPDRPILSVTLNWHDYSFPPISLLGVIPPGTDVTVSGRIVRGIAPEHVEEWLKNEWKRKDAILSAPR